MGRQQSCCPEVNYYTCAALMVHQTLFLIAFMNCFNVASDIVGALGHHFGWQTQPVYLKAETRGILLWISCISLSCSGTEQRFMQASMAAAAGKPMLSDEEYDDLKAQLRNKNSRVVQQASFVCTQHSNLVSPNIQCICCGFCAWAVARPSSAALTVQAHGPCHLKMCICAITASGL